MNPIAGSDSNLIGVLARYLSTLMSYNSNHRSSRSSIQGHGAHNVDRVSYERTNRRHHPHSAYQQSHHYQIGGQPPCGFQTVDTAGSILAPQAGDGYYRSSGSHERPIASYQRALRPFGIVPLGSTAVRCEPQAINSNTGQVIESSGPLVTRSPENVSMLDNSLRPQEIASELNSFCIKFQIPQEARPWTLISQTTADRLCVAFKLPPGVSTTAIANKVSEYLSQQARDGSHRVAMDMRERNGTGIVRLAWRATDSRCDMEHGSGGDSLYNCLELAYASSVPAGFKAEGLSEGQPMPVLVKFSRPGAALTQVDARIIELALYLGFVRPPSVPEGSLMRTSSSRWEAPSIMMPSLLDTMCDRAFSGGFPFGSSGGGFWEPYGPAMGFMRPPMFGYLPSFEEMFEPLLLPIRHSQNSFAGWPTEGQITNSNNDFHPLLEHWGSATPQLERGSSSSSSSSRGDNFITPELPRYQQPYEQNVETNPALDYYGRFHGGYSSREQQHRQRQ